MNKTYCLFLLALLICLMTPLNSFETIESSQTKNITVELKGEVNHPGVYTLNGDSTVNDLLVLGEVLPDGDTSRINLTASLKDGDVVVIESQSQDKRISINSASLDELVTLPRIGEAIAQRIIDYRYENGSFQSLEQLMEVKGIGSKTFELIKDLIKL